MNRIRQSSRRGWFHCDFYWNFSWMIGWILAVTLQAGDASSQDFELQFLDGRTLEGKSFSWNADELVVNQSDGEMRVQLSEIRALRYRTASIPKPDRMAVLVDGTELAFSEIEGSGERWSIVTEMGQMNLPPESLEWVQFRRPIGAEVSAWAELIHLPRETDLLIISRDQGVLDKAGGEILNITKDVVGFDFDGQKIEAPRERLLGIQWFRKTLDRVKPTVKITMRDGSTLHCESAQSQSDGTRLNCKLLGDWELETNLSRIAEIDFSSANLIWLADCEPLEAKATPRGGVSTPFENWDALFAPKFESRELEGVTLDQDLVFRLPGTISFRVPSGARQFQSSIQRINSGDARAALTCEVWENDTKQWEGVLEVEEEQLPVQLDVHPGKRLRLVVSGGPGLVAGCEVSWLQPRLLR